MNFISANSAASSLNWSNKYGSEEPLDTQKPGGRLKSRRGGTSPGRGEQQDERTFTPAAQEAPESPTLQILQPLEGKMESPTPSKQAFATSLTLQECFPSPSLCAQQCAQLHCCRASSQVNCTCTLHHLFSCTLGLILCVHISFTLSSTATASKPSRRLTSPSLSYLCPPQL